LKMKVIRFGARSLSESSPGAFPGGARAKVISEAMENSSVAFTMGTYSHIIEGVKSNARALPDEVLPTEVSRQNNASLTPLLPDKVSIN
jgi:hypothetical protein